ncbi:hypothetical protein SUGI_0940610 [Cryptomeria japonica]|nr:hypothetical protein SUGI_0940610 [Cryptomeria japonica]
MANTYVNSNTLVWNLSTFELEEFGPSGVEKSKPAFHASTSSIGKSDWKALYAKEMEEMKKEDEEFEQLEALFSRRVPKCHFPSRYPERNSRFEERARRYFRPNHDYQKKHKYRRNKEKSCYYVEEEGVTDFDDEPTQDSTSGSVNGKEWVFLAIKEDDSIPKEKALAAKVDDKDEWVIDSGCSHHMTRDKRKFLSLKEFTGGLVRFGDDKECMIKGRGTISLDGKHNTDNVYYVEGLRNNLLSVGQLVDTRF